MSLEYYDGLPNSGLRFKDGASSRSYCLSPEGEENDHCLHNFKGSIAIAHYNICPRAHESAGSPIIRELVRNIDQSEQVPLRPPFERVIQVQRGRASDIQVFGYTEDALDTNAKQPDDAWRLLRQNLYLGQQSAPFLVLHWKHTIMSIRMLDVIPQNGTRLANRS